MDIQLTNIFRIRSHQRAAVHIVETFDQLNAGRFSTTGRS